MHVHAVRLSRRLALNHLPAVHGKKGFEYRIDEQQHGEPWRNFWMSRHEEHGELRQPEAEQIGAAVSQENLSLRVVPGQEPEQGTDHRERGGEDEAVSYQS